MWLIGLLPKALLWLLLLLLLLLLLNGGTIASRLQSSKAVDTSTRQATIGKGGPS